VTTSIGSSDEEVLAVAIQSDGKVIAVGFSNNGSNNDVALVRYNTDGSLDNSFGTNGKVTTAIGSGRDEAIDIAIQSDGKIVVAGMSHNGTDLDFAVVRYEADGSLDSGFGTGGKVTTDIGVDDEVRALAIQSDGKIVAVGYSDSGSNLDIAVVRYTASGVPDTTFDGDGIVTTSVGSADDRGYDVAIQSDGKIVVTGDADMGAFPSTSWDFAVLRYNSDGSLDTGFDSDGKVTTDFEGGTPNHGRGVVIQSDGKIVVSGSSNDSTWDVVAARYASNGSLDTSFDGDGKVLVSIGGSHDFSEALALQSDGKIVMVGSSNNGSDNDFGLVRLNTDGSLDGSFDGDGKVTTPIGSGHDTGSDVAIQGDGRIVMAGPSSNGSDNDFAIARYYPDGSLDDGCSPLLTPTPTDTPTSTATPSDTPTPTNTPTSEPCTGCEMYWTDKDATKIQRSGP
jgi:uncharacterized delta-60 repeat protein